MSEPIPFIDAHHHLWDMRRFTPAWIDSDGEGLIDDYSPIRGPFLIDDLLADFDGSNVVKSVHIQTGYAAEVDPVEETAWLQSVADEFGFPHGIVAYADLSSSSVARDLDRHGEYPNLRGIRTFVQGEDLLQPPFMQGLRALREQGLVYDLATSWEGMAGARQMAKRLPDLQIILGHAGMPTERSDEYFQSWRAAMNELAQAENVAVKISGLGLADQRWTTESIRPWVLGVVEAFGIDRCMFATNWPVDKLFSSYGALVSAYRRLIEDFTPTEQNSLMHGNAERLYGLT